MKIKDVKFRRNRLEFTLCHQKPERSFFWKGKQLPMCARCTGIHLGYFAAPLVHTWSNKNTFIVVYNFDFTHVYRWSRSSIF